MKFNIEAVKAVFTEAIGNLSQAELIEFTKAPFAEELDINN